MSTQPLNLFLDSSDLTEVKKCLSAGIIQGVTTNPTIMKSQGLKSGVENLKQSCIEIANLIKPYPLSIELLTNNSEAMIEQAQEFSSWAANINIKIPIHGVDGGMGNLEVIHRLHDEFKIKINATAIMSAQQALLAAYAGAEYTSIFCGRIKNMGHVAENELEKARKLINGAATQTRIIACSVREISNITEWLMAGADIVTVPFNFLKQAQDHPYSKETVKMFLEDAKNWL